MRQLTFYTTILTLLIISLFLIKDDPLISSIVLGVISAIIFLLIDSVAKKLDVFIWLWYSVRYRNTFIRFSISYLFRIKIEQKYFLVKSKRFPQFQPVGGVFKRYPSSNILFQKINALDDNLVPIDQFSMNDLRIRIQGKYIVEFIRWLNSCKGREFSGWREFYEELIESEICPQKIFPFINYQYLRRYEHPLRYSEYAQSHEILIAEIYELIPTPEQESYFRELVAVRDERFIWADSEQIRRRGAIPGQNFDASISEHSQWIL